MNEKSKGRPEQTVLVLKSFKSIEIEARVSKNESAVGDEEMSHASLRERDKEKDGGIDIEMRHASLAKRDKDSDEGIDTKMCHESLGEREEERNEGQTSNCVMRF